MSTDGGVGGPRWVDALLRRLVPERHREAFLGDLAEEARLLAAREGEPRARRWLAGQLLRSLPHLLRMRLTRGAPAPSKWWGVGMIVLLGPLQAWDSGVHESTPPVAALVALAIVLPALALAAAGARARLAAALLSLALVAAARVLSPTPLPELGLVAMLAWMAMLLSARMEDRRPHPG